MLMLVQVLAHPKAWAALCRAALSGEAVLQEQGQCRCAALVSVVVHGVLTPPCAQRAACRAFFGLACYSSCTVSAECVTTAALQWLLASTWW